MVALGAPLVFGGPPGWIALGILGLGTLAVGAMAYNNAQTQSQTLDQATDRTATCRTCPCARTVVISRAASPQAAQHIVDAQAAGHPSVLTIDRPGAPARRRASTAGHPIIPGNDRDEYPPAMFAEGGAGASIRSIPLSDNRSAGAQMRSQLLGAKEGCKVTMTVGP
ncbi:sporulation protein [Nostoc sp. 3335mG]|nr:sporulation protein [Nostoc sp. 3335mG]